MPGMRDIPAADLSVTHLLAPAVMEIRRPSPSVCPTAGILALDRDLFRRVRSYRNALFDHAVLNEEKGENGPVVLFGQTAGVVEGHQEAEVFRVAGSDP